MTQATGASLAPLYSTLLNDPDMTSLVEAYVAEMPDRIHNLETALELGDVVGLQRLAHKLRGSAGGYGFASLASAAGALELAFCHGDEAQQLERVNRVLTLCRRVAAAVSTPV